MRRHWFGNDAHLVRRVHIGEESLLRALLGMTFLTLFALGILVPFFYMVLVSLKSPAEMGNGRALPEALVDLFRMRPSSTVLLRAHLSDEQLALLNTAPGAPYGPVLVAPPAMTAHMLLPAIPRQAIWARRLAVEKPATAPHVVIALYELTDPEKRLRRTESFVLLCPHPSGNAWMALPLERVPNTVKTLAERLLVNYRALINWETLAAGHLAEWVARGYPRWYFNSLLVAVATVVLGVFLDSLAGFAFAKFDFPLRRFLFGILVATLMVPFPVTLVPSFFIFAKLGLYNTYVALVVPGLVSAFGIFLVRQYVQTIPDDLLAAARADGASDWELYWYIVLPTARPVLAALAVLRFLWQWNSYLYPLVLTNRDSMKTLQLGLATLQESYSTLDYGVQMAGATLAVLPILGIYLLMQRHFLAGITMGSVKG